MKETTGCSLDWGTCMHLLRVLVAGASLLAVAAATPVFGQTDWVAYNDCVYDLSKAGSGTDPTGQSVHYIAPNVTEFGIAGRFSGSTSCELLDQATGTPAEIESRGLRTTSIWEAQV